MNQPHVFISYAGENYENLQDVRAAASNPNNLITFVDRSLADPVRNSYGHINRRPPSDPASEQVKQEIQELLQQAGKLLVLVGPNTHSHEWVLWEVDTFLQMHSGRSRVMFMRIPGDYDSGMPRVFRGYVPFTG
ncbi:TIR domain-containing protein [Endozoicomonas euniceicola]|uniref:TIR domain-containing protein n=1 Tax=Endozoicomonas euniceicola TaxID=1234143 RepID=A0ABY6GTT9_9GAMM|nr:TIR domain-containing protein [Endozoicomonas euniceicola]UYM15466.1 TIR domain-containing protein [Endozoicomonas euniceicola]